MYSPPPEAASQAHSWFPHVLLFCAMLTALGCADPEAPAPEGPGIDDIPLVSASDSLEAQSVMDEPLYRPALTAERRSALTTRLEEAAERLRATPDSWESWVWYGRRLAYLGQYRDAVATYTAGLERFPDEPHLASVIGGTATSPCAISKQLCVTSRLPRVRSKARPDEVEPDGQPNAAGIPTSTLQTNIWYHLGLARYVTGQFGAAADAFRTCLDLAANDDMRIAAADWLFMSLARDGRVADAEEAIAFVEPDMELLENHSYHQRLLLYRGLSREVLTAMEAPDAEPLTVATLGYGAGNYYLVQGDTLAAAALFERVLETGFWPAFGYIAAEADLARLQSPLVRAQP